MPSDIAAVAADTIPAERASDPSWFRQVLGQYPTGVCVITAAGPDGERAGFVVGSFTSVSLSPPMVAFFPDKSSTSWPRIERAGRFCVNVLAADQEDVCRRFASRAEDKFAGLAVGSTRSGMPLLDEVVAWIDCELEAVHEAGDHYIVLGRVLDLDVSTGTSPLLFFQGGYGRFARHSVTDLDSRGQLAAALRAVEMVRTDFEDLAALVGGHCVATTLDGNEVAVIAGAGFTRRGEGAGTLVGQRLPFSAPTGSVLAAWGGADVIDEWLSRMPSAGARDVHREHLTAVRRRGYSLALRNEAHQELTSALDRMALNPASVERDELYSLFGDLAYDPSDDEDTPSDARLISVPVFDEHGAVAFALTVYGFAGPSSAQEAHERIRQVREIASRATDALGGRTPTA
ncbi:flavin reductase [Streptomyces sp. NPDC048278]|uniref:flavin reductase n=1 Tax=unclassified Streptomyces TaxID=2593676 RepID=UPI00343333E2